MIFKYFSCNWNNFTPVCWWQLSTGSHQKNPPSHWNVNIFLPINSEGAHRSPPKSVSMTLQFPADHVAVPPAVKALSHRLVLRCLSTWCKEVRKANERQELVKPLWQLEVWPSGICWAPFHGLWFPPHSLWKVTLAWWAHRSLWGSSVLQTTGRCAITHTDLLSKSKEQPKTYSYALGIGDVRKQVDFLYNCFYQLGTNAPGTKLKSPQRKVIHDVSLETQWSLNDTSQGNRNTPLPD